MYSFDEVLGFDPELAKAMDDELARQRSHTELYCFRKPCK